ncbi:MAG: LuxR C-terminal-related transcriptional regulator [Pseudonocardiaceae bacterium]
MARATSSPGCLESTRSLISGRVRELGALHAERQRSALGELRVTVVLGDAGLGKTRLAAELLPRDNELAVGLIARSSPLGGMPLFGPWADALGLHAGALVADGICRVCGSGLGGLPALVRRAEIAHDASSCAQALRYHFVEWLPGLLAKASTHRPIIVILDDAHQVHDAVWEMLLRLAWDFPASHVFVLVTARPAELARHRMAVEVLHALEQAGTVHRVALSPLSWESVRELAEEILRRDRVPSALVDWLMARARGNPRFVVGLVEALVDNGADLQAPALGRVPEKLARWVRTEVARLDPSAQALVELLAAVGDLIDPEDLARIAGQPIEDIALTLEQLVRSGMVIEQQRDDHPLGYQVAHPLTREVLCTDIGGTRLRVLHRRAAGTLLKSGRAKAAASHLVQAAQAGDGKAIDELGVLGHALGWQGRFDAAEEVLTRSVTLATATGHFAARAHNLALLASLDACRGHLVSARLRWAQAAASNQNDDPTIGGCGAFIDLFAGDLAMVAVHARQTQGHDPAARYRLPVRLAAQAAMAAMVLAAAERGCLTEARRNLDAMTHIDGRPLGVLESWCWWADGMVTKAEGRLAAAVAVLQRAVDSYSTLNVWAPRGFVLADLAEVAVAAGDSDAAARATLSAEDNARRTGAPLHQTLHQFVAAWALVGRDRHDQAAQAALRAVEGFGSSGYALLAARARVVYANAVRRSDTRAAQDALREAIAAFDACGAVPRREQARTLLRQLGPDERCTPEAVRGPGSLTRRERQIAELAARGYTAPQIATQLHIGVRTVETHLARSYPKLGVTSKQQLVHRATELGFTPYP